MYTICFIISDKSLTRCTCRHSAREHQNSKQGTQKYHASELITLSALKLPSSGLVVYVDIKACILTEGRNFKTFLKENFAIASGS